MSVIEPPHRRWDAVLLALALTGLVAWLAKPAGAQDAGVPTMRAECGPAYVTALGRADALQAQLDALRVECRGAEEDMRAGAVAIDRLASQCTRCWETVEAMEAGCIEQVRIASERWDAGEVGTGAGVAAAVAGIIIALLEAGAFR